MVKNTGLKVTPGFKTLPISNQVTSGKWLNSELQLPNLSTVACERHLDNHGMKSFQLPVPVMLPLPQSFQIHNSACNTLLPLLLTELSILHISAHCRLG